MTVTSYPLESEMSNPPPNGRAVSLQIAGGTVYWLSPGGSVTISGNKDMMFDRANAEGDFIIQPNPMADSLIIRVDSQIQLVAKSADVDEFADDGSLAISGINIYPKFDIFEFMGDVMQNMTGKTAYLTWRSKAFTGIVKNFTITQRAGEGNLVDVSFTFQVGQTEASSTDWWPFD